MSVETSELVRLYVHENLTIRQIYARVRMSPNTIIRRLHEAGVPRRGQSIAVSAKLKDRDWLYRRYIEDRASTPEIAKELGCANRTVGMWLARHKIKARAVGSEKGHSRNNPEEVRIKMRAAKRDKFIGADNPNWRGGIALKDPERNRYRSKMWVKAVKDRDGWKCIQCDSTDRLHAHHIKRWVDYPELRYDTENGVTLCYECHEEVHGTGFKFRWPTKNAKSPTSASVP